MRNLIVLGALLFIGCQDRTTKEEKTIYFDLPELTRVIIDNMDNRAADVAKTFTLNNTIENKLISATDSAFWSRELALMTMVDLNAPKFGGVLELSEMNKDSNSNLLFDRITVSDDKLELQGVDIYYLEEKSQIRMIKIDLASSNFITKSKNQLIIWLNEYNNQLLIDSLVTKSRDKVLFQEERYFESEVQRVRR